jgi:hypothetical protein
VKKIFFGQQSSEIPPTPLFQRGARGDFWNCPTVKINSWGWSAAELGYHLSVADIFSLEVIHVYPRSSASHQNFLVAALPRRDLCG